MECKFFIGQKVVCIWDQWGVQLYGETMPVKGRAYTIREMGLDYDGSAVLRFEEIVNSPRPYTQGFIECWFWHERFAPTTDITIFNEILANAPKELEPV